MKFCKVLQEQCNYAKRSIEYLEYSFSRETLYACDNAGNELFMQDHEASEILDAARKNAEERFTEETLVDNVYLLLYPYVDLFE